MVSTGKRPKLCEVQVMDRRLNRKLFGDVCQDSADDLMFGYKRRHVLLITSKRLATVFHLARRPRSPNNVTVLFDGYY